MKDDIKQSACCDIRQKYLEEIERARDHWRENVVDKRVARFNLEESPTGFYTPASLPGHDFLEKVGFPGQYPYTAGNSPFEYWRAMAGLAAKTNYRPDWGGAGKVGKYGGFGTAEDYRDYLRRMHSMGRMGGPNIAFDLATQCGYDSDDSRAEGEVGRVGVAVDSFADFETIYEPYVGDLEMDKVSSNFTINAPCSVILAMYYALAKKRGVDPANLTGTPQNDILKEFIARGTHIFPPSHSLRLFRDSVAFMREKMPKVNICSLGGYHIREAGATREQDLAFSMANAAAYVQVCLDAGLAVDDFAPMITFNAFGGSMELYHEVAFQRAARRFYARMMKERFGATSRRSMIIRQPITAHIGCSSTTLQRPLNNWVRATVGGVAAGMSGGVPGVFPPWDEPLGLGHSQEAVQMQMDASRILIYESGITEVCDPWAGSYFMESLTDRIEEDAWAEFDKIEQMGGSVAAIENGYMPKAVAKSAYEKQKQIEAQEKFQVGVNCFTGDMELDVRINRAVEATYDPAQMATAENRQVEKLRKLRAERHGDRVTAALDKLRANATDESRNLMPDMVECVEAYCTLQEICDVLRDVFGEAAPIKI
ncbi:MAG: methylmalonyl-CoA mutase family protein [Desulfatibacillaceae bacterium]